MDPSNYVTKDSGERKTFSSGMVRDTNADKLLWHLVFSGPMLKRWVALLTRGAKKYSPNNWMKANGQEELDRFRESAARHFAQWMNGETDEDHAAAVVFNINGAEYVKEKHKDSHGGRFFRNAYGWQWWLKADGTLWSRSSPDDAWTKSVYMSIDAVRRSILTLEEIT